MLFLFSLTKETKNSTCWLYHLSTKALISPPTSETPPKSFYRNVCLQSSAEGYPLINIRRACVPAQTQIPSCSWAQHILKYEWERWNTFLAPHSSGCHIVSGAFWQLKRGHFKFSLEQQQESSVTTGTAIKPGFMLWLHLYCRSIETESINNHVSILVARGGGGSILRSVVTPRWEEAQEREAAPSCGFCCNPLFHISNHTLWQGKLLLQSAKQYAEPRLTVSPAKCQSVSGRFMAGHGEKVAPPFSRGTYISCNDTCSDSHKSFPTTLFSMETDTAWFSFSNMHHPHTNTQR